MNVWVVSIDHKYGSDASVHTTQRLATKYVANFAREWWRETGRNDDPEKLSDQKAIDVYFEEMQDREFFSITKVKVNGFKENKNKRSV